jgi:hypothetical protein
VLNDKEKPTNLQNHLIEHIKDKSRDTAWAIRKDNSKDRSLGTEEVGACLAMHFLPTLVS